MDGIHDLGGRQGFGPVETREPDEVFHAPWEGRVWGIVRAMTRPADWSIDWFRHCRELIDPVDYLTRPYFDQWVQTYAAMLVNSGAATVEEVASGRSQSTLSGLKPPMPPEAPPRQGIHAQDGVGGPVTQRDGDVFGGAAAMGARTRPRSARR